MHSHSRTVDVEEVGLHDERRQVSRSCVGGCSGVEVHRVLTQAWSLSFPDAFIRRLAGKFDIVASRTAITHRIIVEDKCWVLALLGIFHGPP